MQNVDFFSSMVFFICLICSAISYVSAPAAFTDNFILYVLQGTLCGFYDQVKGLTSFKKKKKTFKKKGFCLKKVLILIKI